MTFYTRLPLEFRLSLGSSSSRSSEFLVEFSKAFLNRLNSMLPTINSSKLLRLRWIKLRPLFSAQIHMPSDSALASSDLRMPIGLIVDPTVLYFNVAQHQEKPVFA